MARWATISHCDERTQSVSGLRWGLEGDFPGLVFGVDEVGRGPLAGPVVAAAVVKSSESREHKRSVAIDRILTGKYTAFPVFAGVMFLMFWLTFWLYAAIVVVCAVLGLLLALRRAG